MGCTISKAIVPRSIPLPRAQRDPKHAQASGGEKTFTEDHPGLITAASPLNSAQSIVVNATYTGKEAPQDACFPEGGTIPRKSSMHEKQKKPENLNKLDNLSHLGPVQLRSRVVIDSKKKSTGNLSLFSNQLEEILQNSPMRRPIQGQDKSFDNRTKKHRPDRSASGNFVLNLSINTGRRGSKENSLHPVHQHANSTGINQKPNCPVFISRHRADPQLSITFLPHPTFEEQESRSQAQGSLRSMHLLSFAEMSPQLASSFGRGKAKKDSELLDLPIQTEGDLLKTLHLDGKVPPLQESRYSLSHCFQPIKKEVSRNKSQFYSSVPSGQLETKEPENGVNLTKRNKIRKVSLKFKDSQNLPSINNHHDSLNKKGISRSYSDLSKLEEKAGIRLPKDEISFSEKKLKSSAVIELSTPEAKRRRKLISSKPDLLAGIKHY